MKKGDCPICDLGGSPPKKAVNIPIYDANKCKITHYLPVVENSFLHKFLTEQGLPINFKKS